MLLSSIIFEWEEKNPIADDADFTFYGFGAMITAAICTEFISIAADLPLCSGSNEISKGLETKEVAIGRPKVRWVCPNKRSKCCKEGGSRQAFGAQFGG